MEKCEHLAIASVPVQKWNQIYDEEQSLEHGTIFPELNKPFYVTVQEEMKIPWKSTGDVKSKDGMLLQIQKTGFMIDDLCLYMDTHPDDTEGLKCLKSAIKKKKKLMCDFALQFYPLTAVCMADIYEKYPDSKCYCWQEGPAPWEGV